MSLDSGAAPCSPTWSASFAAILRAGNARSITTQEHVGLLPVALTLLSVDPAALTYGFIDARRATSVSSIVGRDLTELIRQACRVPPNSGSTPSARTAAPNAKALM